jgi:uncharacterized protein
VLRIATSGDFHTINVMLTARNARHLGGGRVLARRPPECSPYRLGVHRGYSIGHRLAAGLLLLVVALLAAPEARPETAALRLDGVRIQPELALTSAQRTTGLMNRRRAPKDGMLFVFRTDTRGGFWMKDTLVPLKIVFFGRRGEQVQTFLMTPCRTDSCRIYSPRRAYRFALELPATDKRSAKRLGPLWKLNQLSRTAN